MKFKRGDLVEIKASRRGRFRSRIRSWGVVREIDHDPDGRRRHLTGVSLVLVHWLHDRGRGRPSSDWEHASSLKIFEKEPSK